VSNWISEQAIKPWQILADCEVLQPTGQHGATSSFIGTMRDFSERENLEKMVLEHYPQMTERYLAKLEKLARCRWPLQDCVIVHRVGDILPGDPIVVIGCWSAHRRAAIDACDWLIEELKHNAPFWKKEFGPEGAHWVEQNTDGHSLGNKP